MWRFLTSSSHSPLARHTVEKAIIQRDSLYYSPMNDAESPPHSHPTPDNQSDMMLTCRITFDLFDDNTQGRPGISVSMQLAENENSLDTKETLPILRSYRLIPNLTLQGVTYRGRARSFLIIVTDSCGRLIPSPDRRLNSLEVHLATSRLTTYGSLRLRDENVDDFGTSI